MSCATKRIRLHEFASSIAAFKRRVSSEVESLLDLALVPVKLAPAAGVAPEVCTAGGGCDAVVCGRGVCVDAGRSSGDLTGGGSTGGGSTGGGGGVCVHASVEASVDRGAARRARTLRSRSW
jgi:uncharacterized membrane protein YgcG